MLRCVTDVRASGAAARHDALMRVVDAFRSSRSRLPAEALALAALLRDDPQRGLAAVPAVMEAIGASEVPADARMAALEAPRAALLERVEPVVRALRSQPIPFQRDELVLIHRLSSAMNAMRDAFKRIHADLCTPDADGACGVPQPRAMLALARALDLHSRLLVAAARSRIATERAQWDELCRLAYPLWRLSAIDEVFPDPVVEAADRRRGETPRSALALPLLMRLLEPLGLSANELELAHGLARSGARRASVRIDLDGLPHVNPDGPALMLSAHHTVQVDTRDTVAALQRCVARLARGEAPSALGLRTKLAPAALGAVLERLLGVWGAMHVPTPLVRPPVAQALLYVGLPRRLRPSQAAPRTAAPLAAADGGAAPVADAPSVYVYGRHVYSFGASSNDVSPGLPQAQHAAARGRDAARDLLIAAGETVQWRGRDARRAVFARTGEQPRLRLGQLVAVLPRHPGDASGRTGYLRPGSGPTRVLLGRVVTLCQTGGTDSRHPFGNDVGVAFWAGAPNAVRIRIEGATSLEDAWCFEAAAGGEAPSLVLRRDLFERPVEVVVRAPEGDREWRIATLLERGADFDRVALAPIG
jgi:hypothetical protein